MINPWLFYWMSISDSVKALAFISAVLMSFVIVVTFFYFGSEGELDEPHAIKTFITEGLTMIVLVLLLICIPSKRTCMEMLIANETTEERIEMVINEVERLLGVDDETS